ncbi:DUF4189 domain-containing protein [Neisseria sp. oral taxon 014]|uniref:DUF4189 domain-containing protein n=1 Tax=Neisseria sp. oral taxon 014 TaxID=641148 RepID=UPI000586A4ED|nr:DUF4189 domain-containing protein [Neisseria sp. oral taxon 014]
MKKIFVAFILAVSNFVFANGLNAINDPVMNPCIQRPYLAGCSGNNQSGGQPRQIINIPTRWGAIYYNAANQAIGYSENNTKGYRSANKEALANCIKAGGGKNPLDRNGEGCSLMTEYRNMCGAIVLGGAGGRYRAAAKNADSIAEAEQKAISACEAGQPFKCTVRYSGCSRHPDYLRY